MKKSLLALAVLGAFAASGTASAQSNVTVYGIVDIGLTHTRSDVAGTRLGLDSGNWYGSRLGFRGTEDLGGGLSVSYMLENGFSADSGALLQNALFGRQSWLSVKGNFGALTFGRQWTPAYTTLFTIDPFEDGLAGGSSGFVGRNVFNTFGVRLSNAIDYKISAGGFSADVAYALGEVAGNSSANRQLSGAFKYGAGPLNVLVGLHSAKDAAGTGTAKFALVGGTYDFGAAKLHLGFDNQETDAAGVTTAEGNNTLVGLTVPLGQGRVLASYNRYDDDTAANIDIAKFGIAYVHDLSKRTTLYTSYARTDLNSVTRVTAGIRHKF